MSAAPPPPPLLDLNTATVTQLLTLPHMTRAVAASILAHRQRHAFTHVDEMQEAMKHAYADVPDNVREEWRRRCMVTARRQAQSRHNSTQSKHGKHQAHRTHTTHAACI